jgi:flagellar basal body-associated protein FliL
MKDLIISIISIIVVVAVAFFLSSRFKLSNRYERQPENLSSWNRQDLGQDPSAEGRE